MEFGLEAEPRPRGAESTHSGSERQKVNEGSGVIKARARSRETGPGVITITGGVGVYLLRAELSSSRRLASLVEVLSSFDRLSILFRITSSMSLIFFSTPRDSTPPSTGVGGLGKGGGGDRRRRMSR